LDQELRAYLEMAADEKIKQGMSRRAEGTLFGRCDWRRGTSMLQGNCPRRRLGIFCSRCVGRICASLPACCAESRICFTVILTLGLGIGLNSAIFTVASGFLLREPPVKDSSKCGYVDDGESCGKLGSEPSYANRISRLCADRWISFEGMAAVLIENLPLIGRGDPESVTVARVTSNYFVLLGVPAHLGERLCRVRVQRNNSSTW